jgi:hypothetical protein
LFLEFNRVQTHLSHPPSLHHATAVFIIGPAGCGKSVVWNTLINVYNTISKGGLEASGPKTAVFEVSLPLSAICDEPNM